VAPQTAWPQIGAGRYLATPQAALPRAIHQSFFGPRTPDYVYELLSERALHESEFFDPATVTGLVRKAASGTRLSEVDDMALVGILSTQLVYHQFVKTFKAGRIRGHERMKIVDHALPADGQPQP